MQPEVPEEYVQYLATNGAYEGFTKDEPGYIVLWSKKELPEYNSDIEMEELAPGFIAFAGNGGGEVLAFDATGAVFMLPMIGMEPRYATKVANSFAELARRFTDAD